MSERPEPYDAGSLGEEINRLRRALQISTIALEELVIGVEKRGGRSMPRYHAQIAENNHLLGLVE